VLVQEMGWRADRVRDADEVARWRQTFIGWPPYPLVFNHDPSPAWTPILPGYAASTRVAAATGKD
jgi:hypothetical protein